MKRIQNKWRWNKLYKCFFENIAAAARSCICTVESSRDFRLVVALRIITGFILCFSLRAGHAPNVYYPRYSVVLIFQRTCNNNTADNFVSSIKLNRPPATPVIDFQWEIKPSRFIPLFQSGDNDSSKTSNYSRNILSLFSLVGTTKRFGCYWDLTSRVR